VGFLGGHHKNSARPDQLYNVLYDEFCRASAAHRAHDVRRHAQSQVRWWHRNLPRKPESVGLYRWDEGDGFFPDFVVAVEGRTTPQGIVLLEVKGGHLWGEPKEVEKSTAVHPDYGPVLMVGRRRGEREFHHLRKLGERLETDGVFSVDRLRHV
jgi:hypothetical protein